jgi:hypothetical protein
MTLHTNENGWPHENTVIVAGSVKPQLALRASFEMPEVGPKRRVQMSGKLFDAIINDPNQGHFATGINPAELNLNPAYNQQLRSALGRTGCQDVVGIVIPEDLWSEVEGQAEKLWRIPVAVVDTPSSYRAIMLQ